MSDFIPCTPPPALPSFHRIANKIRILNHFLNDRDLEELTREDMASAATLAEELDAQIHEFGAGLRMVRLENREVSHVAQ